MPAPFPVLNGQRLVLRQIIMTDLDSVYEGLSHPDAIRYYGVSYSSREETLGQMNWYSGLEKSDTGIWWAICDREDGTFLGAAGLNDLSREHRKAELGYWLLPAHWGNGFMKEVFALVLDHAFEIEDLHRIEAFVDPDNDNSKRVLSRAGFEYEGTMRDCELKDGKFLSEEIYAFLKNRRTQPANSTEASITSNSSG